MGWGGLGSWKKGLGGLLQLSDTLSGKLAEPSLWETESSPLRSLSALERLAASRLSYPG